MPMLTDMGYPAHWLEKNTYWTSNTISHYAVVVDQHRQETMNRGYLNTLAASPGVQLMDADAAQATYPGTCSLYRRTTALIDTAPDSSYLLDIYRVNGGYQHDYSFHGPPFPEFTAGAEPGPSRRRGRSWPGGALEARRGPAWASAARACWCRCARPTTLQDDRPTTSGALRPGRATTRATRF